MIFYINFTIFICYLLYYSYYKLKVGTINFKVESVAFFVIAIISLLRYDVGWDYVAYHTIVEDSDLISIARYEPLSKLLFNISIKLNSPQLVFFLYGIPTYYLIYKSIKKYSISPRFSIILYFSFFYLESFGLLRQALAVAICFWGFQYIYERKFLKYICTIVFAFLFHYSAIIALFIYPLYGRVKYHYIIWSILILFAGKKIAFAQLTNIGLYTYYLEVLDTYEGGALIRWFYIILYISLYAFKNHKTTKQEHFLLYIIGIATSFPFLIGSHLGVRLSSYFFIYLIILIPLIIRRTKIKCFYVLIAILFFILTLLWTTYDPIKSQYVPYQFFFEPNRPYFR